MNISLLSSRLSLLLLRYLDTLISATHAVGVVPTSPWKHSTTGVVGLLLAYSIFWLTGLLLNPILPLEYR